MSSHNDGGNKEGSSEWFAWCLQWLMLKWLARINLIQRCVIRRDAWTKGRFSWNRVLLDVVGMVDE